MLNILRPEWIYEYVCVCMYTVYTYIECWLGMPYNSLWMEKKDRCDAIMTL